MILTRMANKEMPINIYLDQSKAFNTLDHSILILYNYLINIKQYVEIEKAQSEMFNISTGVPQGSILGPFIYNFIYNLH